MYTIGSITSYKALWLSIAVIWALVMTNSKGALDLQLHDTYYVIAAIHLAVAFSIFLGLVGLTYWVLKRSKLIAWMKCTHVLLTIVTLVSIMAITIIESHTRINNPELFRTLLPISIVVILLFAASQLLFVYNVITGIIRGKHS